MARTRLLAAVVAAALLVGCTAGDQGDDTESAAPTSAAAVPTGPSPGVTDDTIKVGVTFVDLDALGDLVTLDHGDYTAVYEALFDDINANGGINGRQIEPVIVGVNPVGADSAEAACVRLTEDEDVFLVMGFFLTDSVGCVMGTHQTAVVGGSMSADLLSQAQAPWFTWELGSDANADAVRAMAEGGELDGDVGVVSIANGEDVEMNEVILPLLDDLGIDVVDSGVVDAPADDVTAQNAATAVIAERFQSEGIDQVILVGATGLVWAGGTESSDYRPELRITNPNSILAYINDASGRDLSVLDGAVAGNLYGGAPNTFALDGMQACLQVVEDAGIEVPDPAEAATDAPELWVAPMNGCTNVTLARALLEAAGPDLNYGTLAAGAEGLEVDLPGQPEPVTYGSPPAADGDPPIYLYDWDPDVVDFVIREG